VTSSDAAGRAAFPGFSLRLLARTPSTQDLARAAARAGAPEGWCCVADEQTAGRGRQGRRWEAPPSAGLLFSIVLRPPAEVLPATPLAAGLAVADAVAACGADGVRLKWPNDVLSRDGGKLAGLLAEMEPGGPAGPAVVMGVGLNLTVERYPEGAVGASLHHLAGRRVPRDEALAALLTSLGRRCADLAAHGVAATVAAWRERAVGLGAEVEVATPHGLVRGLAVDVGEDGALLVDTGDTVVAVLAGDVHLLPNPPA
jgi:BirA family transcriptional regulator, biotin operon repressor / biotin---[acetyl-CoA-carboxylase] ligase